MIRAWDEGGEEGGGKGGGVFIATIYIYMSTNYHMTLMIIVTSDGSSFVTAHRGENYTSF